MFSIAGGASRLKKWFKPVARVWAFGMKNRSKIAYYGGVALVLAAVAVAAEQYRRGDTETEPLILPPAEVEISAQVEPVPVFTEPQGLTLLRGFSQLPQWNETLGLWETHAAVDYQCTENQIVSLSEGIVQTIGLSGIYGGFVEVVTDQYLVRYASLTPAAGLSAGDPISAGDVLGTADDSMPGENHLGAHLHLELECMGERVSFLEHASDYRSDAQS